MNAYRRWLPFLGVVLVLGCAWLAPLDSSASQQVEAGLKRALASFATARALNAVISVAQGTEVVLQPAGVGVTFTPGQVLDSINDLVEQFSLLMLMASVALGIELALIKVGAFWAVSLLLSTVALAWAWWRWRQAAAPLWLTHAFIALLLVRFAMPLVALGSEAAFQLFLADEYAAHQATIESSAGQFARLSTPGSVEEKSDPGWLERLRGLGSLREEVGKRVEELKDLAGRTVEHIVKLIVVFLLQTLVLPLLMLWLLLKAGRALADFEPRAR
jgi:hypothetical protein